MKKKRLQKMARVTESVTNIYLFLQTAGINPCENKTHSANYITIS